MDSLEKTFQSFFVNDPRAVKARSAIMKNHEQYYTTMLLESKKTNGVLPFGNFINFSLMSRLQMLIDPLRDHPDWNYLFFTKTQNPFPPPEELRAIVGKGHFISVKKMFLLIDSKSVALQLKLSIPETISYEMVYLGNDEEA